MRDASRVVALPVAQVIPIALKEACRPAVGQVLPDPYALTKVLARGEGPAGARGDIIAQADADPEIFSDPKVLADTQTYSGAEA